MTSHVSPSAPARRLAGAGWALALLLCSGAAAAHGAPAGAATDPSDLPPGPLKRSILDIEKRVEEGKHPREIVELPKGEALRAAERARGAHAAGDGRHGGMLSKLAEQWVGVAVALLRAAEIEKKATSEAKRVRALRVEVERAEALLAEQQARLGRLQAEVKAAEAGVRGAADRTKLEERERIGAKKPAKPPPPEKKKEAP
jgi:acyl-coenzyme A thioesterase PaaI-like protein